MDKKKITLGEAEQKKLRSAAQELVIEINNRVIDEKRIPKINGKRLSGITKEQKLALLEKTYGRDVIKEILKWIKVIKKLYKHLKSHPDEDFSTHQFITRQAAGLISLDEKLISSLDKSCILPDKVNSDMFDLIQEGHFYGKLKKGGYGNYMTDFFTPSSVLALSSVKKILSGQNEDISEHASINFFFRHDNFIKNHSRDELGVAAHYLQDLTAPHHVSNLPAFLPEEDTHVEFETWAKKFLKQHGQNLGITQNEYKAFKSGLKCDPQTDPKKFMDIVYKRACVHNSYLENKKKWADIVSENIPLAIFATAYIFEPLAV